MKNLRHIIVPVLMSLMICCNYSCGNQSDIKRNETYALPDTLVVGTLYSPTSYFIYKGDVMGYNYDLMTKFANDKGIVVKFEIFRNMPSLLEELDSAKIDVIAYNIPVTAEYNQKIEHCGLENITTQVLVQTLENGRRAITDVTQLAGKEVYVERGSKYEARLVNLNDEIGGGIKIHTIARDTLMQEDLIEMVADGDIPLTIVDNDIAKLDHTYYPNIDISLNVSFPQRSSWAVRKSDKWLADTINLWAQQKSVVDAGLSLFHHYFETNKVSVEGEINIRLLKKGIISHYDEFFKENAELIGWDWKMLAAQGYVESNFNPQAVSWAGARGVMQLMPATARRYGLDDNNITDPECNIKAAAKLVSDLDKALTKYVPDKEERIKFILAAYNSGIAHIYDAIALARKFGKNPQVWNENVSEALLMKAYPEYYNDEVCKYGYFRGRQTVSYVSEVMRIYHLYKRY